MAAITAAMVKELREITGLGMMDCKKALVEADGNMEEAIDSLRKSSGLGMIFRGVEGLKDSPNLEWGSDSLIGTGCLNKRLRTR